MNIRITVVILFFLVPFLSTTTQAQLAQLILPELAGEIAGTMPTEEEAEEVATEETKERIQSDFKDEDYGYTGGKNFNNPPQEKFFDEALSYFGYDFFNDAPSTFAPVTNIPVPSDYVLGPKDNIKIILFGNKTSTFNLEVTREGEIFFPGVGPIALAGLTFQDARETITQIVTNQMIGTKVNVTMGKLRSINVFVLGEASQPGMYTISALSTLVNAIFINGGINVTGSLRNIQLKRKGEVISTLDFYDLLLEGDTSKDTRLTEGDVVFIPTITKTVGTDGEIGRPAIYELKDDETLGDLIRFAGNLKPKADLLSAEIQRVDGFENSFDLLKVNLDQATLDNFELKSGDIVKVYPVVNNLTNAVLLSGHALQPGFFPWKEGMRIGDLIKSSDGFLSMTDLNYVLIKREDKVTRNYTFLQTDLVEVFKNPESDVNLLLSEKDQIILFPSLLSQDQITTRLIQDKYIVEDEQMVLENEWNSLTYLRKSLMEKRQEESQEDVKQINPLTGEPIEDTDIRRYYEYTVYDYCTVPEELAVDVIESAGFSAKKSVPLEDLEDIKTPDQFQRLLTDIQTEKIKAQTIAQKDPQLVTNLTRLCRQQLLDPIIEIINRQTSIDNEKGMVSIFGNVHFPGSYPFTDNMTLNDSIKAAGGPKNATYESEIELSRSMSAGKQFSFSNSIVSMTDTPAMLTELKEMDVITLKQMATNTGAVEITGEVFFTGVYPISEYQTLGELIRRAGGITNNASVEGAYFVRKSLQEAEIQRLESAKNELRRKILLSSQAGGLGKSGLDGAAITQLTALIGTGDDEAAALGRLVVDLQSILDGTIEDIVLEDGDKLHIPTDRQTISVIGEVYVANSHLYESNLSIDDYIDLSGGATEFASESNTYLIKVDGSIVSPSQLSSGGGFFRRASSDGLQPGDTIVIPLEVQQFSGAKAATEITQIVYQMAIAAAAVNSF